MPVVFCSVKGENRPKTSLFTLFFSERVENTVFCDGFFKFFTIFQLMRLHSKTDLFLPYFCHRSSGLKKAFKSGQIAKLHLNHFVCHNLCRKVATPKTGGGCLGPRCFMNVPCILPAKKPLPPKLKRLC